jgi:ADP-ribose pyrophosphatase YjhB (NUDIX family)
MREGYYAVNVFVESPEGIPLVRDPKKPLWCWKFPGGGSLENEEPEDTAIREVEEETGLIVQKKNLKLLDKENRITHIFIFFKANVPSLKTLKKIGNDDEEIKVFSLDEIKSMKDFFPNHRRILERLEII